MRVAQVSPLCESVPPRLYGGTERVVSHLTEELVKQGHEVTLFASGDSETAARLVPVCPTALWRDANVRDTLPHHVRLLELVFGQAGQFDVIHFHCDYVHFPLVARHGGATVTTLHGQLDAYDLRPFFTTYPGVPVVAISDSQRQSMPAANWIGTVHHGLPPDQFALREHPGEYLAFLGRISPQKRVDRAIDIARRTGLPLRIAAKIYPEETAYYQTTIAPLLEQSKPLVEFVGEIGGGAKADFLAGARALLFPIEWSEPFGLVMIEALACGTPVIAWRRGSVPEVVTEGVTGYIVDTIDEAVHAVGRLGSLSRRRCRDVFEQRFSASRMASDYVCVYRRAIEIGRRSSAYVDASTPGV